MMETEVPESAIHVSFLFIDFPDTLLLMSGNALFFFSFEILFLLILLPSSVQVPVPVTSLTKLSLSLISASNPPPRIVV